MWLSTSIECRHFRIRRLSKSTRRRFAEKFDALRPSPEVLTWCEAYLRHVPWQLVKYSTTLAWATEGTWRPHHTISGLGPGTRTMEVDRGSLGVSEVVRNFGECLLNPQLTANVTGNTSLVL
jgi:hypothetical protein